MVIGNLRAIVAQSKVDWNRFAHVKIMLIAFIATFCYVHTKKEEKTKIQVEILRSNHFVWISTFIPLSFRNIALKRGWNEN